MFIQLPRLIICGLEDCGSSHGGLGGRDNDEVLARDTK